MYWIIQFILISQSTIFYKTVSEARSFEYVVCKSLFCYIFYTVKSPDHLLEMCV